MARDPRIYIEEQITKALRAVVGDTETAALGELHVEVSFPKADFGDFASNIAFVIAKRLPEGAEKNPMRLAELLAAAIIEADSGEMFSAVKADRGFINFSLSPSVLAEITLGYTTTVELPQLGVVDGKAKKVVFEYSSPNTNKPLHIGHIRNDVYGKACINVLKAVGYDVVSCEIINDRGIHIMKSMLMYQKYGAEATPESTGEKPDHFVGRFYKMFAEKAGESEEMEKLLLEEAGELLRKWEAGDAEVRKLWQQMNDWFFQGVQVTYAKEGTTFDEVDFESQIYDKGKDLVLKGVVEGIFQKEADGSVSVDLTEKKLDKKYLLRKDGTTIYVTQDMYLWHLRNERHHPDVAIVTTAVEQAYHFQVLSELFKLLKFSWADNFKHLPYEHVYLGKNKMSARAGKTISADELRELVKERVRTVMDGLEKNKGSKSDEALVEAVAFGAIKYGYLHYEPQSRIYFDIEETIKLEGATGPYIQYAYARQQSILHKAGNIVLTAPSNITNKEAAALMRALLRYPSIVSVAAEEFKPNLLCTYLYELAALSNSFYAAVPILTESDESIKQALLTVLTATSKVLEHGLGLLGIVAPQEM